MHLKSLTLKGFKSFASATTLRLEPGITCVVGPNGSGKSNVVDALCWVMGEQGAKTLRGGKMQDVIFAGTSGRGPLGRAEVTLVFDNSDGSLPLDVAEVSVTRRVFRDGAGEYEINGAACRLMDVQELLSDAGIGREMHVIVGQGRLSEILESRPEERRAFIEEAAGVLKHRRRKEKALRKLDSMQANLARLTDLAAELRRQLKPLARQAEVARRAQTVQAELRDARLRLAADDLQRRRAELADQLRQGDLARDQQAEVEAELEEAAGAVVLLEDDLARLAPGAEAAAQAWFRLSALAERISATTQVAAERARHLDAAPAHPGGPDPAVLEAQADRAELEEAELAEVLRVAHEGLEAARDELAVRESLARDAERAHLAAVRAVADRREGLVRLSGQVETLRARAESFERELDRVADSAEEALARREAARAELDNAVAALAELESHEESLDRQHERAVRARDRADGRVAQLREAERAAGDEVVSLRARIEALSLSLDVRDGSAWLLEGGRGAVAGPLSTLLRVQPGFEAALAAALELGAVEAAVDAVAAAGTEAALGAVAQLRAGEGGRAVVLLGGADAPPGGGPPPGCRWAAEVVSVPEDLRGAVAGLLRGIAIAPDLEAAARVAADHPGLRVVALDGSLAGRGWVAGGSARRPGALEIQAAVDLATARLEAARVASDELAAQLAGALAEQAARQSAAADALAALAESDAQVGALHEQLGRLGQLVRGAQAEGDQLAARRARAEAARAEALEALAELAERLRRAQEEPDEGFEPGVATAEREEAAELLAQARAAEVDARLAARTAEERYGATRGKADGLRRTARNEREARARAERALAARRHAAEVAAAVAEGGAAASVRLRAAVAEASARRDALGRRRDAAAGQLRAAKDLAHGLTARLSALKDAAHRGEVARAQAALRVEQLEAACVEQLGMGGDDLVAEYGPDVPLPPSPLELAEYEQAKERGEQVSAPRPLRFDRAHQERRLKQAERDLATLGKVNPLALEEFAALEERYTFLSTQLEDVKAARKDLLEVVADVDAKILTLFTEAYADVEREFVGVFQTLFPGGEGRLVLTDPTDMLATGIEVEARPPGKKVKRLSLLSGGEKSLTAVAMLVAIFRARPSPFYVMDEVEAALDDTNLRRLIGLFEQLRERSQLIVITHQKPTMEVADALYGVSMRGDGITTVISQRLRGQNLAGAAAPTPGPAPAAPAADAAGREGAEVA